MSSPQHEPTMEEILASIRKIISEDTPEAPPPAAAAPVAQAESDVLELTQEYIEAPQAPSAPEAAPAPVAAAPAPKPENDVVFETPRPAAPPPSGPMDGIFSDTTRKAIDDTFANIPDEAPAAPAPRAASHFPPVEGASVEAVFERAVRESFDPVLVKYLNDNSGTVIEQMKPLIREWMDEHFPALLEGAVRAEVERVVKARGNKR
jgi:cell pole-organizing protein PopZ